MYKLIDLFSGCGGMTLGFTDPRFGGGFESVFAIDHDKAAAVSYALNFGAHAVCDDIEAWAGGKRIIPKADIVIGGPPCQGFSLLNKDRIKDVRRALWQPYMDLVALCGASVFVIENVPGLLDSEEHKAIVLRAKELGFLTAGAFLNAADYGTPQTRIRAFIFGWKKSLGPSMPFPPAKTHAQSNGYGNMLFPPWRTVRSRQSPQGSPKQ